MWPLLALLALAASAQRRPDVSVPGALTYRTKDGRGYFRFQLEWVEEGVRVYLVEQPGGRTDGCHLLSDGGRKYLCWDRSLPSVQAAKAVTAVWAEREWRYLDTGREF